MGVFGRIFVELVKGGVDTDEIMTDAKHPKAKTCPLALPRF
jgi:hypothetical protein